jgi:hypothetical protein
MTKKPMVFKLFEKLDTNASLIGLRLNGQTEVKSLVGAFISIVSILTALFLSLNVFEDYLYSRSPVITIGSAFNSNTDPNHTNSLDFTDESLYLALTFYIPRDEKPTYSFNDNNFTRSQSYNARIVMLQNFNRN